MTDLRYKQGQELEWIQPEAGMNGYTVGQKAPWRDAPVVTSIRVEMEDGLHCSVPYFAVMVGDDLLRKYNALLCFASGPVRSSTAGEGGHGR